LATSSTPKNSVGNWSCKSCNTTDEALRYKSGMMENCYICQAYENICTNARQKKKKHACKGHVVSFTSDQFQEWAGKNPRLCRYCGINDAQYRAIGWETPSGRKLEALGIDRLRDTDYALENIAWCCYPCNRKKNTDLTPEQMDRLGPILREFWQEALAELSIDPLFPEFGPTKRPRVIGPMPGDVPAAPTRRERRRAPRRYSGRRASVRDRSR
jgi:hypothetical protein